MSDKAFCHHELLLAFTKILSNPFLPATSQGTFFQRHRRLAYPLTMVNSLQVLMVVGSRIEAELIVGRLKSSGVSAFISADDEGGMNLALQPGRVRILVLQEHADKARRTISEFNSENKPTNEPTRFHKWLWKMLGGKIPS